MQPALLASVFFCATTVACNATLPTPVNFTTSAAESAFLDTLQRRTFNWFWETTNSRNGLVPDRWPTKSFSSIAAVGFGLTAYPIGVERGWITREQARNRVLNTLRFFSTDVAGHRGFFH